MSVQIPPFNKIDYCLKVLRSKEEKIVLDELSILSCENAKTEYPKDWPQTKIDEMMTELDAQILKFQDDIEASKHDIENVKKLIEKYDQEQEK